MAPLEARGPASGATSFLGVGKLRNCQCRAPGLGTGRRLGPALGSPLALKWTRPHRDGHGPGRTPARGGPRGRGAGRGMDRDRDLTATATSEAASHGGSLRSL